MLDPVTVSVVDVPSQILAELTDKTGGFSTLMEIVLALKHPVLLSVTFNV